jgi:hypothetical protein
VKAKTITVIIQRRPHGFEAFAGAEIGTHPNSSTCAARAAAARALGVGEAAVELTPTGPDMLEATVKHQAPAAGWDLLACVGLAALVCGGALLVWAAVGGAL